MIVAQPIDHHDRDCSRLTTLSNLKPISTVLLLICVILPPIIAYQSKEYYYSDIDIPPVITTIWCLTIITLIAIDLKIMISTPPCHLPLLPWALLAIFIASLTSFIIGL
eukprot:CRZ02754.1 hypothetical protein [Spongospora subterranea]